MIPPRKDLMCALSKYTSATIALWTTDFDKQRSFYFKREKDLEEAGINLGKLISKIYPDQPVTEQEIARQWK